MSNYDLICEGACNPGIAAIDAKVAAFRKLTPPNGGPTIPPDDEIVADLRRLRHRPHIGVSPSRACCVDCGNVRQYGSRLS